MMKVRFLATLYEPYWHGLSPHNTTKYFKEIHQPSSGGAPRKINAKSCLALCLSYYRFRGSYYILQGWFGMTNTNLSDWLRFTMLVLICVLSNQEQVKIKMPSDNLIQMYASIISKQHLYLKNVFCVCDGLKLMLERSVNKNIQGRFYSGWLHGHYVNNLFVFTPDGRIIFRALNAPGSMHDSTLAQESGLYAILNEIHARLNVKCCMDSAFNSKDNPSVLKSGQPADPNMTNEEEMILRELISCRQQAEWGMRAMRSAFPRINDRIKYEENGRRGIMLECMVLLYNYRLLTVGINEIASVYMTPLEREADEFLY
jgi:DDE superfamily endonuclease